MLFRPQKFIEPYPDPNKAIFALNLDATLTQKGCDIKVN